LKIAPHLLNFRASEEYYCFAKEDLSSLQADFKPIYIAAHGNVLEKREKGRKRDVFS
jgi:hypothetical protein